jgi:hypothetical protein
VNGKPDVLKPASLLNQESWTEDEAIVDTCPAEPVYAKPCVRDGRKKLPLCVELAVEKKPLSRPRVVEVLLYPVFEVNGKTV